MNILVTGGAGFIGSQVADRYIAESHNVVIVDDLSTGFEKNIHPKATFHKLDIRSKEAAKLVENIKPDIINHHAAQIDVRRSVADPLHDAQINILGLLNIMEAAVRAKSVKKVIFSSTGGAIYGDAAVIPTPEEFPAQPVSPYGVAKLTSEHYLYYYSTIHGIPSICLRYANVYGPRQNPEGEAGVVAIFAKKMIRGEQVIINGDGKQTRDYVFVDDVVEANALALEKDISGIFNIGTGKETDVNGIYSILAQRLKIPAKEKHGPQRKGEQLRSSLNTQKAKEKLGWQTKVQLEAGIGKTVAFFQDQ